MVAHVSYILMTWSYLWKCSVLESLVESICCGNFPFQKVHFVGGIAVSPTVVVAGLVAYTVRFDHYDLIPDLVNQQLGREEWVWIVRLSRAIFRIVRKLVLGPQVQTVKDLALGWEDGNPDPILFRKVSKIFYHGGTGGGDTFCNHRSVARNISFVSTVEEGYWKVKSSAVIGQKCSAKGSSAGTVML